MVFSWEIFFIHVSLFFVKSTVVDGRPGYHFTRFSGPVSGPVSQIEIVQLPHLREPSQELKPAFDYINDHREWTDIQCLYCDNYKSAINPAKPDYTFAYGVEDPESGNYQNQKETRDGDVVKGEYTVIDADGSTRRVVYTADPKNGFQATVHLSEPNKDHAARQENFVKTMTANSGSENKSNQEY